MKDCLTSMRCQDPSVQLLADGLAEFKHCDSCQRPVFFSKSSADSTALGVLGHCVQLHAPMADFSGSEIFMGTYVEEDLLSRTLRVHLKLRGDDVGNRSKAEDGVKLYISSSGKLNAHEVAENLLEGQTVFIGTMSLRGCLALRRRLEPWDIQVISGNV